MDDILCLIQSLHEKIDALQEEITELKVYHRPTSSKDCAQILEEQVGVNFETWLATINITPSDLENLFEISLSLIHI